MRNGIFIKLKIIFPPKNTNYKGQNGNCTIKKPCRDHLNQMDKVNLINNETNQTHVAI